MTDVVLVSMPFGPLLSPSLGLSLLQPQVRARGLSCRIEYLTLAFAERIGRRPRVIGFTSVFQQHLASLALARELKARRPGITIVMGGANCEAAMGAETVRQFPFVDAVVSGEADLVFADLAARIVNGEP